MSWKDLYPAQLTGDEIRILTLQRGPLHEVVQCSMTTVRLGDRPKYTALSYVWGDANETQDILVNGITFKATTSLAEALRHMRKTDREELVWADAVGRLGRTVTQFPALLTSSLDMH
jgi:hypothetical protein